MEIKSFLFTHTSILKICKYSMAQMSESEIPYVYLQCCHMLSVSSRQNKCFEFFQNIACTWFERFLSVVWNWDKWNSQLSAPFFIPNTFLQIGAKEYRTVLKFFVMLENLISITSFSLYLLLYNFTGSILLKRDLI